MSDRKRWAGKASVVRANRQVDPSQRSPEPIRQDHGPALIGKDTGDLLEAIFPGDRQKYVVIDPAIDTPTPVPLVCP